MRKSSATNQEISYCHGYFEALKWVIMLDATALGVPVAESERGWNGVARIRAWFCATVSSCYPTWGHVALQS